MAILIVDDSPPVIRLLQATLNRAGYNEIICADSGEKALDILGVGQSGRGPGKDIDCILLDIIMPGIDGVETCDIIKNDEFYRDTPVLMVTIKDDAETLQKAFEAGASDYITKPVREIELLARVKAAIHLKKEMDIRKSRENELLQLTCELEEANKMLGKLAVTDDVTNVGNRRFFLGGIENEWRRSFRNSAPLSVIFVEIDRFADFADYHGESKSNDCLKLMAQAMRISLRREGDYMSRYGGSVFAIYLPRTGSKGAEVVAGSIKMSVDALQLKHSGARDGRVLTVSIGCASIIPTVGGAIDNLLIMAEESLNRAKNEGGNQIICSD